MEISAEMVSKLREKTGLGMMLCKKSLIESGGDMEKAVDNLRKQGELTAAKRAGKAAKEGKVSIVSDASSAVVYEVNCETDFVGRNDDFLTFVTELGKLLLTNKPRDLATAGALTSPVFGGRSVDERLMELVAKIGEKIAFRRFVAIPFDPQKESVFSYIHGNGKIGVAVKLQSSVDGGCGTEAAALLGKDLAMQVAAASPVAANRESVPADTVAKETEIYHTQAQTSGKPEKIWDKIVEGKLNKFYAEAVLVEQEYIRDTTLKVSDRVKDAEKTAGCSFKVVSFVRYELGAEV